MSPKRQIRQIHGGQSRGCLFQLMIQTEVYYKLLISVLLREKHSINAIAPYSITESSLCSWGKASINQSFPYIIIKTIHLVKIKQFLEMQKEQNLSSLGASKVELSSIIHDFIIEA